MKLNVSATLGEVLKAGLAAGLFYFLAMFLLLQNGLAFSTWPDWVFRLSLIGAAFMVSLRLRFRQKGILSFWQAFWVAGLACIVLALSMAPSQYLLYEKFHPEYHSQAQAVYREHRKAQMLSSRADKKRQANPADTLTAADIAEIEPILDKHIELTSYFFSTKGSIYSTWLFALVWTIGVSFTVGVFVRRNPESD